MKGRLEVIARIVACLLALFLFGLLVFYWVKQDLHNAVVGRSDGPPKELVAAINHFYSLKLAKNEESADKALSSNSD